MKHLLKESVSSCEYRRILKRKRYPLSLQSKVKKLDDKDRIKETRSE